MAKKTQKNTDGVQTKYKHEGYEYIGTAVGAEKDTYSVEHRIVETSTGKIFFPDFTSYCFMSKVDFQNFIKLGMPKRVVEYRPLSSDDIRKLNKKGSKTDG